jgi:hypothetical protein
METNKPTDPQIKVKCELCDGGGGFSDDTVCDACDDGFVSVVFDAGTLCFYGDSSHSEWGQLDNAQDMAHQLECCYDAEERAKLTAWFAGNAAYCAELAVDARKELCSKFADEAEVHLHHLQSLLNDAFKARMPSKRLTQVIAHLSLAIADMRADKSIDQTINSQTLAVSLELANLADAATQIGKVTLAKVAADDAVGIIEALKDVA